MTNEELNTALYKKLLAELDTYRNWLMQQPPDEILRHTYEFTTKQDIVLALEYNDLTNEQAQALLSSPAPLDEIFHDFEQIEGDHMDIIWGCMDQLSVDKFDVEHIAPKEQMRKLIDACNGDGLPISCIANLCYLPESANRSKGAKNFYQDKKYRSYVDLAEVESKYSFTEQDDFDWMDMPYEKPEDFVVLQDYYTDYCTKRFE